VFSEGWMSTLLAHYRRIKRMTQPFRSTAPSVLLALSAWLALGCAAHRGANSQSIMSDPQGDHFATTLKLGMELKQAEAFLTRKGVVFETAQKSKPIPGKSLRLEGKYPGSTATVALYFVADRLWEIKIRDSESLCQEHARDLGVPVAFKAGCSFWANKDEWFSAFSCPSPIGSALPGEGATCFFVSLQPLAKAGLSKADLEEAYKEVQPPSP
jgi:hypothetical protein